MKILYDHQIFERQKYGGISRYFYELYCGSRDLFYPKISIIDSDNEYLRMDESIKLDPLMNKYSRFFKGKDFKGKKKIFYYLKGKNINRNKNISINSLNDCDVFHPTYYDPYFLNHIGEIPYVLTVYDMIHEFFPEFVGLDNHTPQNKELLCKQATRIIAISNSTKKDLIDCYNIDENKIDVIYLGSSLSMSKENSNVVLPSRYILFVGNRTEYKNFYFLIFTIKQLLINDSSLKVLCTGSPFSSQEMLYFRKLGIDGKIIHFNVRNDNDFSALYSNALCFVFPSLYEGFGIPILEAFSCQCPVILSNSSCFPEIAEDAAVYFNPKDAKSILESIVSVINSKEKSEELIHKGLNRLKNFSWEKTIKQTKETYKKAIKREN